MVWYVWVQWTCELTLKVIAKFCSIWLKNSKHTHWKLFCTFLKIISWCEKIWYHHQFHLPSMGFSIVKELLYHHVLVFPLNWHFPHQWLEVFILTQGVDVILRKWHDAASLLANGSTTFIWKLCCYWLIGWQHHHSTLPRQNPGILLTKKIGKINNFKFKFKFIVESAASISLRW